MNHASVKKPPNSVNHAVFMPNRQLGKKGFKLHLQALCYLWIMAKLHHLFPFLLLNQWEMPNTAKTLSGINWTYFGLMCSVSLKNTEESGQVEDKTRYGRPIYKLSTAHEEYLKVTSKLHKNWTEEQWQQFSQVLWSNESKCEHFHSSSICMEEVRRDFQQESLYSYL